MKTDLNYMLKAIQEHRKKYGSKNVTTEDFIDIIFRAKDLKVGDIERRKREPEWLRTSLAGTLEERDMMLHQEHSQGYDLTEPTND